jgi:hypothetical protein
MANIPTGTTAIRKSSHRAEFAKFFGVSTDFYFLNNF